VVVRLYTLLLAGYISFLSSLEVCCMFFFLSSTSTAVDQVVSLQYLGPAHLDAADHLSLPQSGS
jgi:hypothetical protein